MRSRTNGRWWGSAIQAPDPSALARSRSQLLDRPIGQEDPGARRPMESIRALLHQAGHPLCLCLETE